VLGISTVLSLGELRPAPTVQAHQLGLACGVRGAGLAEGARRTQARNAELGDAVIARCAAVETVFQLRLAACANADQVVGAGSVRGARLVGGPGAARIEDAEL